MKIQANRPRTQKCITNEKAHINIDRGAVAKTMPQTYTVLYYMRVLFLPISDHRTQYHNLPEWPCHTKFLASVMILNAFFREVELKKCIQKLKLDQKLLIKLFLNSVPRNNASRTFPKAEQSIMALPLSNVYIQVEAFLFILLGIINKMVGSNQHFQFFTMLKEIYGL